MKRRKMDVFFFVQETKWKGDRAKELVDGYRLIYYGIDKSKNGIGIICSDKQKQNVILVHRCNDRCMMIKLASGVGMVNVISVYAPQIGCTD